MVVSILNLRGALRARAHQTEWIVTPWINPTLWEAHLPEVDWIIVREPRDKLLSRVSLLLILLALRVCLLPCTSPKSLTWIESRDITEAQNLLIWQTLRLNFTLPSLVRKKLWVSSLLIFLLNSVRSTTCNTCSCTTAESARSKKAKKLDSQLAREWTRTRIERSSKRWKPPVLSRKSTSAAHLSCRSILIVLKTPSP